MSRRMGRVLASAAAGVALVAVIALVAMSFRGDDAPGADEARLDVDGSATVTGVDGSEETVTDSATLSFGDVVSVQSGTATLEFAAGQQYELRAASGESVDSELVVETPPTLLAGDALVAGGFPAAIRYDTTIVSAQGALKVRAGVPEAAAYSGRATISGAGRLDEVVGLRQVVLTASATPEPFAYDGTDPWDRRFLGEAIAFGQRLEALARGYTSDLQPATAQSVSFFESVLPALDAEREFNADLLDDRPAGETLVGAAIVIQGREGTFRERWDEVFAFRDAGAAWGLVALDQGVSSAPVLEAIELAIDGSPLSDDPPPATTTTRPAPSSPTTAPQTPTTPPPTTPPPDGPPPDGPPPDDDDGVLTPVVTPVEEILTDVLEALGLG